MGIFQIKTSWIFYSMWKFSIVFDVDMTSIKSGDELKIQPIISYIIFPLLSFVDWTNKYW